MQAQNLKVGDQISIPGERIFIHLSEDSVIVEVESVEPYGLTHRNVKVGQDLDLLFGNEEEVPVVTIFVQGSLEF